MSEQNQYYYTLPSDPIHLGILQKFQGMKFEVITGRGPIKGKDGQGLPPDLYVPVYHRLHDLVRGFYKPQQLDCLLSYQATEKLENYGKQIKWLDQEKGLYAEIHMAPPSSSRDKRAKSDIQAARITMQRRYPIGILFNQKKGVNRILGLGLITEETSDGIFIVKPIDVDFIIGDQLYHTVVQDIQSDKIENGETENHGEGNKEGRLVMYYGKRYERDPKNRALAIKIHGCKCIACGFDFQEKYGEWGKDFIEVHHIKPISSLEGKETVIDPKQDLVPVCSNCHRMIHRRPDHVLSVEELREILQNKEYCLS